MVFVIGCVLERTKLDGLVGFFDSRGKASILVGRRLNIDIRHSIDHLLDFNKSFYGKIAVFVVRILERSSEKVEILLKYARALLHEQNQTLPSSNSKVYFILHITSLFNTFCLFMLTRWAMETCCQ